MLVDRVLPFVFVNDLQVSGAVDLMRINEAALRAAGKRIAAFDEIVRGHCCQAQRQRAAGADQDLLQGAGSGVHRFRNVDSWSLEVVESWAAGEGQRDGDRLISQISYRRIGERGKGLDQVRSGLQLISRCEERP